MSAVAGFKLKHKNDDITVFMNAVVDDKMMNFTRCAFIEFIDYFSSNDGIRMLKLASVDIRAFEHSPNKKMHATTCSQLFHYEFPSGLLGGPQLVETFIRVKTDGTVHVSFNIVNSGLTMILDYQRNDTRRYSVEFHNDVIERYKKKEIIEITD